MGLEYQYINGQTPLDQDEINGLKIKSISSQKELNEFEQMNIEKAIEWSLHGIVKHEVILTEKFVKNLHKRMYDEVWKWAGSYRKSDKNIGVNWYKIGLELKNLLDDTQYWIIQNTYIPEEIALRFKHRLVSIHCFPNGNGRHSRLMADIIISSIYQRPVFSWNSSNMVDKSQIRMEYISALKKADGGDIKPLIEFALG